MLLRNAFCQHPVEYATTGPAIEYAAATIKVHILPDCNLRQPFKILACLASSALLVARLRPQIVISTGAAPGLLCILWGRLMGAQTLWIDSIANAERLSLSGRVAMRIAHRCLTQWQHLAQEESVHFEGAVL